MNKGWKYYNHAMLPDCPPHEQPDIEIFNDKNVWKRREKVFLIRWTTDFDCGYETNWWYVIKDDAYEISSLKSKDRYTITKSRKNFYVCVIHPGEFAEEMYKLQVVAFGAYPKKYRPKLDHDKLVQECKSWTGICFGAFLKDSEGRKTDELCGFSYLTYDGRCLHFQAQKTNPAYEKLQVNAALVDGILTYFNEDLKTGKYYICDGERNMLHQTAFQDYLEKYFGFRKAYCKLHVVYKPSVRIIVSVLYPFRKILKKMDNIRIIHNVNGVLKMEELCRSNDTLKNTTDNCAEKD